jgi:hypothetical protein
MDERAISTVNTDFLDRFISDNIDKDELREEIRKEEEIQEEEEKKEGSRVDFAAPPKYELNLSEERFNLLKDNLSSTIEYVLELKKDGDDLKEEVKKSMSEVEIKLWDVNTDGKLLEKRVKQLEAEIEGLKKAFEWHKKNTDAAFTILFKESLIGSINQSDIRKQMMKAVSKREVRLANANKKQMDKNDDQDHADDGKPDVVNAEWTSI